MPAIEFLSRKVPGRPCTAQIVYNLCFAKHLSKAAFSIKSIKFDIPFWVPEKSLECFKLDMYVLPWLNVQRLNFISIWGFMLLYIICAHTLHYPNTCYDSLKQQFKIFQFSLLKTLLSTNHKLNLFSLEKICLVFSLL